MRKTKLLSLLLLLASVQVAWAQQTWTEVSTASDLTSAITNGANIRLTHDITLSTYLKIGENSPQTVTIDLNGHTLQRTGLNSADTNGHVIEVWGVGTLTLTSSNTCGTLTGGWAENGGGICNFGNVTLNNITITGCKAENGGGIYNKEGATLTITGGSITNCFSHAGGGAIVNHGTATISGCTMSENTATTRGGAIWNASGLTVENTTFSSNKALADGDGGDGGALHLDGGTATLNSVTISGNTSKDAGGIYLTSNATLNLDGTSTISGNSSTEHGGGGIDNYGTVVMTGNVTITGNSCHGNGAGIWTNGTLRMEGNIQIKDNTGDDLYLKKGNVINVTGALTGGAESIMVCMESSHGKLTNGYTSSGTTELPFKALKADINKLSLEDDGEYYLLLGYYDCSWDENTKQVDRAQTWLGRNVVVDNLCSAKYASGGGLEGQNYVFIVDGTASIPNGLTAAGDCKLILFDGSSLTVGGHGITVVGSDKLRIYGQELGTGKLIVTAGDEEAAIGSKTQATTPGAIEIRGGYVEAHGGESATGIGGAAYSPGGSLTIYDGTVKAYGGEEGAAIGSGFKHTEIGTITIYGGTIYAEGGDGGAGIGTSQSDASDTAKGELTVYGGTINAWGGVLAAGIGGGIGKGCFTVNIHGGNVYAWGGERGAGIGSGDNGEKNEEDNHGNTDGGVITITGGIVDAIGGYYGAGIGGGRDSSGGTVKVSGGTVRATGGTDAAGIGSGKQPFFGFNTHGGSLTVTGGEVIAQGTGWGAGIGAGEYADGATVVVSGGTVTAIAGSDAGEKNGCAIGSEDGDGHRGSLTIGSKMMVHAGQDTYDAPNHLFPYDTRVPACYFRPCAIIEVCDHQGATYTVSGTTATDTHTLNCSHCLDRSSEEHTFVEGTTTCSVCHVSGSVSTISIYLPEAVDGTYTNGHYASTALTEMVVTSSTITLPTPPVSYLPVGVEFAGWAIGTPTSLNITSYWKDSNETVYTSYTVNSDISITARYTGIEVSLADDADNGETLYLANDKKAQSVTLSGRTLYKDGNWNTLCLPFNLTIADSPLSGDGVDVRTLSSSTFANGALTLNFTAAPGEEGAVTRIEAGKPYLIKWDDKGTTLNETDLVFSSVTIHNNLADASTEFVDFIGTYSPTIIYQDVDEKTRLYLGSDNKLYYPTSTNFKVNACRGYFQLKNGLLAGTPDAARAFVLNFGDDDSTQGVTTPRSNQREAGSAPFFSLDGRRLSGQPSAKGIYISSGRKIIIK